MSNQELIQKIYFIQEKIRSANLDAKIKTLKNAYQRLSTQLPNMEQNLIDRLAKCYATSFGEYVHRDLYHYLSERKEADDEGKGFMIKDEFETLIPAYEAYFKALAKTSVDATKQEEYGEDENNQFDLYTFDDHKEYFTSLAQDLEKTIQLLETHKSTFNKLCLTDLSEFDEEKLTTHYRKFNEFLRKITQTLGKKIDIDDRFHKAIYSNNDKHKIVNVIPEYLNKNVKSLDELLTQFPDASSTEVIKGITHSLERHMFQFREFHPLQLDFGKQIGERYIHYSLAKDFISLKEDFETTAFKITPEKLSVKGISKIKASNPLQDTLHVAFSPGKVDYELGSINLSDKFKIWTSNIDKNSIMIMRHEKNLSLEIPFSSENNTATLQRKNKVAFSCFYPNKDSLFAYETKNGWEYIILSTKNEKMIGIEINRIPLYILQHKSDIFAKASQIIDLDPGAYEYKLTNSSSQVGFVDNVQQYKAKNSFISHSPFDEPLLRIKTLYSKNFSGNKLEYNAKDHSIVSFLKVRKLGDQHFETAAAFVYPGKDHSFK